MMIGLGAPSGVVLAFIMLLFLTDYTKNIKGDALTVPFPGQT